MQSDPRYEVIHLLECGGRGTFVAEVPERQVAKR